MSRIKTHAKRDVVKEALKEHKGEAVTNFIDNYFQLFVKLENLIADYWQKTANLDRNMIAICLTTKEYYILRIALQEYFDNLYSVENYKTIQPSKYKGIDLVVSDKFTNTPFIAEKGEPII